MSELTETCLVCGGQIPKGLSHSQGQCVGGLDLQDRYNDLCICYNSLKASSIPIIEIEKLILEHRIGGCSSSDDVMKDLEDLINKGKDNEVD